MKTTFLTTLLSTSAVLVAAAPVDDIILKREALVARSYAAGTGYSSSSAPYATGFSSSSAPYATGSYSSAFGTGAPYPTGTGAAPYPSSTGGSSPCAPDGAVICNGLYQFGLCNFGMVVFQPVAPGTECVNGKIQ